MRGHGGRHSRSAAPPRPVHPVGSGDPDPPHQVALIESGPRLGCWVHRLSFQTLGADRKEGGVEVAAPFARMEELLPILAEAGFPRRRRARTLSACRGGRCCGERCRGLRSRRRPVPGILVEPRAGSARQCSCCGRRRVCCAAQAFLCHGRPGAVRRGRTPQAPAVVDSFPRAQTISVSSGPLQRRLRLGTVLLDTAGASMLRPPRSST